MAFLFKKSQMKYYIIAGEASGDLHGSNLMKALYEEDPQADRGSGRTRPPGGAAGQACPRCAQ